MTRWKKVRVPKVAFFQEGPGLRNWQWALSGIKVINGTNIREDGHFDPSNTDKFITLSEFEEKYRHFEVEEGDIVVSSSGTIGKVARIERHHLPMMMNTSVIRFHSADLKMLDDGFLFAWLRSPEFQQQADSFAHGAAQRNFGPSHVKLMEIGLPPLPIQRRIASILGAYDDLIEVNRRRIAVLEEMARRLFDEWFVHFRFPGHEGHKMVETEHGRLPEGWRLLGLYDLAEVAFGFPFKSPQFNTDGVGVPVVRIRDVLEGASSTWTDEPFDARYEVVNGDLLIGMDGIFHTALWSGGEAALNQRVTRLRPKRGISVMWLLLAVLPKIKYFEATISGTTVAHLGARDLKATRLMVATDDVQRRIDGFLLPAGASILNMKQQNRRLAASRDLLLPRLISGDLSVTAAERELETAA